MLATKPSVQFQSFKFSMDMHFGRPGGSVGKTSKPSDSYIYSKYCAAGREFDFRQTDIFVSHT